MDIKNITIESLHNKVNPHVNAHKKTICKNYRGDSIAFTNYQSKEDISVADIELKFKGLPLELAAKVMEVVTPLYEDPYKQLEIPFEVKKMTP